MKTAVYQTTRRQQPTIRFPNAASRRYFLHKLLDLALMAAIGAGLAACVLLLMVFV